MIRAMRYSLMALDILLLVCGLIMLISGSVIQARISANQVAHSIGTFSANSACIISIVFGIIMLFVSALGLYATVYDRQRVLVIYCAVMVLIFVVLFVTGVSGLAVKNSSAFNDKVEKIVKPMFTAITTMQQERDFYQEHFQCCGWNSFDDYSTENSTIMAPRSCCKLANVIQCHNETTIEQAKRELFRDGCEHKFFEIFREVFSVTCSILVTISLINLASIVLSLVMSHKIRTGYQYP